MDDGEKLMGQLIVKRVGSGNKDCKMWVSNVYTLAAFKGCVEAKLGPGYEQLFMGEPIEKALNW